MGLVRNSATGATSTLFPLHRKARFRASNGHGSGERQIIGRAGLRVDRVSEDRRLATASMTSPESCLPHLRIRPSRGWSAINPRELWAFRDVLVMLALRDIKLRYKQTALGVVWVVLQPLVAGAIFAVIFGHFARLPSGGRPYVLFVFAGLLGWNLFAGILQRAGNSLVAEAKLITKVYFPRLLIPCAAAAAALVDFCVSLVVMACLLAVYGVWPGWWLAGRCESMSAAMWPLHFPASWIWPTAADLRWASRTDNRCGWPAAGCTVRRLSLFPAGRWVRVRACDGLHSCGRQGQLG